jgi:transposase
LTHRGLDSLIEMRQQEANLLDVSNLVIAGDIGEHVELLTTRIEALRKVILEHMDNDPDLREGWLPKNGN